MKKVKIIGTAYPFRGGLAAYNERLAREMLKMGMDVEIETFTIQYPGLLFPGKTQYVDWDAPADLSIRRTVSSINPFNWLKVGRRIRKERPDLLIFKYWLPFMAPCFGSLIRCVKRNKHTRVIAIADNIIAHEPRPFDRALTNYFMKSIDGIVAMSNSVYQDILSFRTDLPRALCPHPLFDNFGPKLSKDQAIKRLNLDPSFHYLLFFGFIRDYKGLDLLLKAMAHEELKKQPLKLIVAGEFYTNSQPYLDLIQDLHLQDKVILYDRFIADQEVGSYFCAADIVVQPYKDATQSGVTQIGYHFEKPMLVTNVGGLPEIIPDQKIGYVVEPDAEAIARALLNFYQESRQGEFEQNIAIEKQKFTWERMVKTITEIVHQIPQL